MLKEIIKIVFNRAPKMTNIKLPQRETQILSMLNGYGAIYDYAECVAKENKVKRNASAIGA